MFDVATATPVKVAIAAIIAPRHANALRRFRQIHRPSHSTSDAFQPLCDGLQRRMPRERRGFAILARAVMTGQAINRI